MARIIGGEGRGRRLKAPRGHETRPTGARVRQTLFDILAPALPGCRLLDAFAGSGGVGLEALSRGAARVVFVDLARAAVDAVRANLAVLGAGGRASVMRSDARAAVAALARAGERFEVVFVDPPYDSPLYEAVIAEVGASLLAEGGVVVAEHFHKRVLPETIGGLTRARVVRVGDHCLSFYRPAPAVTGDRDGGGLAE